LEQPAAGFATRKEITFAVTLLNDGRLVGAMALIDLSERYARGELGYWIGVDY
jgi:hypothetical protein